MNSKGQKVIYYDSGHGGKDPGAVSGIYVESALALKIGLAFRDFMSAYDCEVVMSRTTDVYKSPQDRYNECIAVKADLSICGHLNSAAGTAGDGYECYAWYTHAPSFAFAKLMAAQISQLGQNLRPGNWIDPATGKAAPGVKVSKTGNGYSFAMCRVPAGAGITSVLSEVGFVNNPTDRQFFDTDAELVAIGQAYGRAAVAYLGLKLKAAPVVIPSTPPEGEFKVVVVWDSLNIRKYPRTWLSPIVKVLTGGPTQYTIVAVNGTWGKLKSGAGWISLKGTKRI